MKLNEVFEEVEFKRSALVNFGVDLAAEFPLDFLAPNTKRNYSSLVIHNKEVLRDEGKETVLVPLIQNKRFNDEETSAGELLLAAAADRNIVVYDDCLEKGFDNRLVALMNAVMIKNGSTLSICKMTDFFMDESVKLYIDFPPRIHLHRINHDLYNYLLGYYLNDLQGSVKDQRYNICLGVDLSIKDSFVLPTFENKYGMAVLDNRKVLLGRY